MCLSERRQDLRDVCTHDVAPAGHMTPVREPDRSDDGVAPRPASADRTDPPCGFRNDRHRTRGVTWLSIVIEHPQRPMSCEIACRMAPYLFVAPSVNACSRLRPADSCRIRAGVKTGRRPPRSNAAY